MNFVLDQIIPRFDGHGHHIQPGRRGLYLSNPPPLPSPSSSSINPTLGVAFELVLRPPATELDGGFIRGGSGGLGSDPDSLHAWLSVPRLDGAALSALSSNAL